MTIIQALILGVVQGVTELLPISSSAHLILVPNFFTWVESPLVFDTTLHLGTALALIIFFLKDITNILKNFTSDFLAHKLKFSRYSPEGTLAITILAGSVPAGLLGVLLGDFLELHFRSVSSVLVFLALGSILMLFSEIFSKKTITDLENVKVNKGFLIGLFQSLALFSGVSRSGATISGGMLLGLSREMAAKYSFLLSIPVVLGAGIFEIFKSYGSSYSIFSPALIVGFISSFISALLAIGFLMRFLKNNTLKGFIIYRFLLIIVISLML